MSTDELLPTKVYEEACKNKEDYYLWTGHRMQDLDMRYQWIHFCDGKYYNRITTADVPNGIIHQRYCKGIDSEFDEMEDTVDPIDNTMREMKENALKRETIMRERQQRAAAAGVLHEMSMEFVGSELHEIQQQMSKLNDFKRAFPGGSVTKYKAIEGNIVMMAIDWITKEPIKLIDVIQPYKIDLDMIEQEELLEESRREHKIQAEENRKKADEQWEKRFEEIKVEKVNKDKIANDEEKQKEEEIERINDLTENERSIELAKKNLEIKKLKAMLMAASSNQKPATIIGK